MLLQAPTNQPNHSESPDSKALPATTPRHDPAWASRVFRIVSDERAPPIVTSSPRPARHQHDSTAHDSHHLWKDTVIPPPQNAPHATLLYLTSTWDRKLSHDAHVAPVPRRWPHRPHRPRPPRHRHQQKRIAGYGISRHAIAHAQIP